MSEVKPPTQGVGVQGFVAFESKPTEEPVIDWLAVVMLPPFQMFAAERAPNTTQDDSAAHALAVVRGNAGAPELFDAYCQWHAAKGYWPNEDPMGRLL